MVPGFTEINSTSTVKETLNDDMLRNRELYESVQRSNLKDERS